MGVFGSDMTVQLALDRHDFHPGESVNLRVLVGGQPDPRVQGGRVELVYKNRYRDRERDYDSDGTSDTRIVTRSQDIVAVWAPLPAAADGPVAFGEHALTLTFPPDVPPSAHEPDGFGDIVAWQVRAILDRRTAFDADAEQPVRVYSRPEQYAWQTQSPPVAKSAEVPMGLDLATRMLRPGESITGTLTVTPRESVKARSVRVQFERRRTDTPDDLTQTHTAPPVQLSGQTQLEAGQTYRYPFEVPLPQGVPPTLNAARNHLHWYVEGIVDRRMRGDFVVEAEVVVYTGNPLSAGEQHAAQAQPPQQQAPPQQQPVAVGGQPADWYPDPWLEKRLRYWDGKEWTGHTAD